MINNHVETSELWQYFHDEHGLLLLEGELIDIIAIVKRLLAEREANNPIYPKGDISNHLYFRVNGAGDIEISKTPNESCQGEEGFSFGVEWGKYGFAGGVLPMGEAVKLAEHILAALSAEPKQDNPIPKHGEKN